MNREVGLTALRLVILSVVAFAVALALAIMIRVVGRWDASLTAGSLYMVLVAFLETLVVSALFLWILSEIEKNVKRLISLKRLESRGLL